MVGAGAPVAFACSYRRGFIEDIEAQAHEFLDGAEELFARAPVRRARLHVAPDFMPPSHVIVHLADRPFLARLTALDLAGALLGNDGLQALLVSPWLHGLTSLGLRECQISDRGVRALAQWPFLTRLTRLDLSHNEIGPPGVRLLARSLEVRAAGGDPSRLVSLPLHGNPLGQAGRRAVHSSPLLTRAAELPPAERLGRPAPNEY